MIGRMSRLLPDRQDRRGQLTDRVLLLSNDPFAFVDETDRNGVGDPVRRGLVGIEYPVQEIEVSLVLLEQRSGEYVA